MLFPTIRFAIFFALVLPVSWLLMPRRRRWRAFMVLASFVFYASWNNGYVLLLAGSIIGNQAFAVAIARAEGRVRKQWTGLAVAANLVVLGWYKYAGFAADSASTFLGWFGVDAHVEVPNLLLPVGISFFTFQALSYVIDVHRRKVEPATFLDFAVYLSFFPHLVAGPIVRARELLPQIAKRRDPRHVDATLAFWLLASGLFKKVVIASYLGETADALFSFPHQHGGLEALIAVYAYAFQIYADFSGYTDMAIGIALLLGFRFPANFDAPYTATSIQDFWRRWHMTLSRWLRDYLYIPLGGNRGTRRRTYRNLLLTMLLGGLWHGAAWTFVIWGGIHGAGLAFERWWHERRASGPAPPPDPAPAPALATVGAPAVDDGFLLTALPDPMQHEPVEVITTVDEVEPRYEIRGFERHRGALAWVRRIIVFHIVCFAWVFFRATSVRAALEVLGRIAFHGSQTPIKAWVVATIAVMLVAQLVPQSVVRRLQMTVSRWSLLTQSSLLAVVLVVVDVLGPTGVAPFIYFQF